MPDQFDSREPSSLSGPFDPKNSPIRDVRPLITSHQTVFQDEEQAAWDECRAWYQGRFWTEQTGESESKLLTTSLNLVYAITETALSTLLPKNPKVTAKPWAGTTEDQAREGEAFVNTAFHRGDYRQEQSLSVQDAVLFGRSVYKTTLGGDGWPLTRALDPRTVFFDRTARRPSDIRYWIEATLLSEEEFLDRRERDDYKLAEGVSINGDVYPAWLMDKSPRGSSTQVQVLKNWQPWIEVWEFYDIDRKLVSHWHMSSDRPLHVMPLTHIPYTLLTLNSNAQDNRGLSEILLVKPAIEDINRSLTYLLNILRLQIPKIAYDSGSLSGEDISALAEAALSEWTGVAANGRDLRELIREIPYPQVPVMLIQWIDLLQRNVSIVSALAEAQRGQVTGARTATELALVEAQIRTRLAARQARIDAATTEIAGKILYLGSKYLKGKHIVERTGEPIRDESRRWIEVSQPSLSEIRARFEVVPYSPIEENRAVLEDRAMRLLPILAGRPGFDEREVDRWITEQFILPPQLRKSDEQRAAEATMIGGLSASGGAGAASVPLGASVPSGPSSEDVAASNLALAGIPTSQLPPGTLADFSNRATLAGSGFTPSTGA